MTNASSHFQKSPVLGASNTFAVIITAKLS